MSEEISTGDWLVYFVQAGENGPVKIGAAKRRRLNGRLSELQQCNHEELKPLRVVPGSLYAESWLHDHYRSIAIRGEWFKFDASMLTIQPPLAPVEEPLDIIALLDLL